MHPNSKEYQIYQIAYTYICCQIHIYRQKNGKDAHKELNRSFAVC
jgi:hypothetical protein